MLVRRLLEKLSRRSTYRNQALKARVLKDRLRGLDFLTSIQPQEVGLDPERAFRSSPSGNRYLEAS